MNRYFSRSSDHLAEPRSCHVRLNREALEYKFCERNCERNCEYKFCEHTIVLSSFRI